MAKYTRYREGDIFTLQLPRSLLQFLPEHAPIDVRLISNCTRERLSFVIKMKSSFRGSLRKTLDVLSPSFLTRYLFSRHSRFVPFQLNCAWSLLYTAAKSQRERNTFVSLRLIAPVETNQLRKADLRPPHSDCIICPVGDTLLASRTTRGCYDGNREKVLPFVKSLLSTLEE